MAVSIEAGEAIISGAGTRPWPQDSPQRSLAKAISYRVLGTLITTGVVLMVTGEPVVAAGVGVADALIKTAAYYAHERAWERIEFGRWKCPVRQGECERSGVELAPVRRLEPNAE